MSALRYFAGHAAHGKRWEYQLIIIIYYNQAWQNEKKILKKY